MSNALRKQYRTLLEAPEILVMPGVFDGFSTAIVEKLGFKAGFVSGAGISESALSLADMGVMGLEDNLAQARALADISQSHCRRMRIQATAMPSMSIIRCAPSRKLASRA